jgi:hypothetical protein
VQVYGVRESIAELRQVDSRLATEAIRDMKRAADPMAATIRAELRTPTLSGLEPWWPGGRVTVNYGGRAGRDGNRPLVRIRVLGRGQAVADMAGRASSGRTAAGRALIGQLSGRAGPASRFAWRTAEADLPAVQQAVLDACERVTAQTNSNLVRTD